MPTPDSTDILERVVQWPFVPIVSRLGLAISTGVFLGLEREHKQKTGVRTFALASLLGCLGGLMGPPYGAIAMGFVAMLVVGINYRETVRCGKLVITTSAAIMVCGFCGILFGQGHVFTPAVAGVISAALLAWKRPISEFAHGLSDQELRSAILLAILTVVILPILPSHPVDPWRLIDPRSNWISVVIIAAIGFVNYILMRLLGVRGMEITAFFGGLVNSCKVIVELGLRMRQIGAAPDPFRSSRHLAGDGSDDHSQRSNCCRPCLCRRPMLFASSCGDACHERLLLAAHAFICGWTSAAIIVTGRASITKRQSRACVLRCLRMRWLKIIAAMMRNQTRYDAAIHTRNQLQHGSWILQLQPVKIINRNADD